MNTAKPARAHLRPSAEGRRTGRVRRVAPAEDAARSLEELRHSILGPEQERIERLEGRPAVAAESVGAVLPEAVVVTTTRREHDLAVALEPTVTDAVTSVARTRPDIYSDALAPTIGAAVRKAVGDAIALIMERFNVALERSLTLRSIEWRLEAARTGRPFAEIALLRTLVYRVEQVFLIHTRTSLVLQHLVDPMLTAPAPDQIAAMLSAIEAFGREAFGPMPAESHLNRFELGELTVWISHDPPLTLAAVVRGTPSVSMATQLNDTVARVRVRCAASLRAFAGDPAEFDAAQPMLEPLLRAERKRPARRAEVVLAAASIGLVGAVIGFVAATWIHHAAHTRGEIADLAALQSEPGIVVTQVEWENDRAHLVGLRDPLATPPETVLAEHRLPPASLTFAPFVSLDPRIVERRAQSALQPPPGAHVSVVGHELHLAGNAPRTWIDETKILDRTVPGVERVDDHALRSQEGLEALRTAAATLDRLAVTFRRGQSEIDPDQEITLTHVANRARDAFQAAAGARVGACLVMTGHTDETGSEERNRTLGLERATSVRARLASMGIDDADLHATGGEVEQAPRARSVTFRLDVDEAHFTPGCGGGAP